MPGPAAHHPAWVKIPGGGVAGDCSRAGDTLSLGITTHLGEGGSERGSLTIRAWDLDQIAWARCRNRDFLDPREEPDWRWFAEYKVPPAETRIYEDQNLITSAGWAQCLHAGAWTSGATATLFSNTVGRVGLGQVAAGTAPNYTDTALGAATGWTGGNWQLNGAAPTYTAAASGTPATMVFSCTFGTGAYSTNAITEFAVDAGTAASSANTTASSPPMVNHGIIPTGSYGTKTSAQTWNTTVSLTFT
jgi:hypothetical protein